MGNTGDNPTVSIIMPTYNRAALIGESIDSVLQQTYRHWELIIVDDGSTDNTKEFVSRIGDPRISFHEAGRIGIGGRIKNIGLQEARGELIAFLDSDDLWAPSKLEKQVAALSEYPGAGFSLCNGYTFRSVGNAEEYFFKKREGMQAGNIFLSFFRGELPGYIQALMLRKNCLQTTGPFLERKSFSDLDFILSLAKQFDAVVLYEPLVMRRIHHENYIHANWEKSYHEGIEILHSFKGDPLVPRKLQNEALFRTLINFGEACLRRNRRSQALQQFFQAWKYNRFSPVPWKKMVKTILSRLGK